MAYAPGISNNTEGSTCPICLDMFVVPRQLSCMHTFCQCCLQSYLIDHVSEEGDTTILCPVSRTVVDIPRKEQPVEEWALSFPINEVLKLASSNSLVEKLCNSCTYEHKSEPAVQFCVECKEGLCETCLKFHQKLSATKDHKTININEISNNLENLLKLGNGFGCPKHASKEIEFFCKTHDIVCCATCLFNDHRECKHVLDLHNNTESLLRDINTDEILRKLKLIEDSLKQFVAQKKTDMSDLSAKVNDLEAKIQRIRRNINEKLDEMEKAVKIEANRLYKEGMIQHQDEIQQCQSLMSAVRNSHTFLEAVSRHGSDNQLILASSKTKTQLAFYVDHVRDIFNQAESISFNLEISSHVNAILSNDITCIGRIIPSKVSTSLPLVGYFLPSNGSQSLSNVGVDVPLKDMKVELSKVVDVNLPGSTTAAFTGIAHLSGDRIVLACWHQKKCFVIDASYNCITSCSLSSNPRDVCVLEDDKMAVTMPCINTIGILSVKDGSILINKFLKTTYCCWGADFIDTDRYVISGRDGNTTCWSILTSEGNEKFRHNVCSSSSFSYIKVNNTKTRVFVTVTENHAVHCFSLEDRSELFVYKPGNLRRPIGIALDRDGNVYVVGHNSDNVHKLSQEGRPLQIISSDVPKNPLGISFNNKGDRFIVSNESSQRRKLHVFQHK
ncbi:hypothetical protein ACJMK2_030320 [Sinanodonta woodiana]|uniref:Uncharacterized protein n=1 Tax=Sinanodonta woodiana TaxID=1069815 RepID=A0ABD3XGS7_SINWO